MKKALFVSYNHNNDYVADSIQNHRLIDGLKKYVEIDVLCRVKNKTNSNLEIYSSNLYFIDRGLYKLFPFLISTFSIDRSIWCLITYFKIRKSLSKYSEVVFTFEPYNIWLLFILICNHLNLKVTTIIYDPYVDNIFLSKNPIGIYIRRKIEKIIVKRSHLIIANNERLYKTFQKRYPEVLIKQLPLCGKPPFDINFQNTNKVKKRIIHAGNIYGMRRIDELNNVVTLIKQQIHNLSTYLEIELYGKYCVGYEKVIESNNCDVIVNKGILPANKLHEEILQADALLLLDPMDTNNFCFPSKLCEYFQYKKPIFGIAGKQTPSYDFINKSGYICCDGKELDVLADSIISLIRNQYINRVDVEQFALEFDPNRIAFNLYTYMEEI